MLLGSFVLLPLLVRGQSRPAYESDPSFQKLKLEAQRDARDGSLAGFVADQWKKANSKAGGHCMECFEGMVTAEMRVRDTKRAVQYAHDMDTAAESPVDHTRAKLLLARAVLAGVNNKKPDTHLLEDAHTALATAQPAALAAFFYDGRVLSLLHRDEEATKAFQTYAEKTRKDDVMLTRAQHFAARPELARQDMAPAMVLATLSGKQFNLDNMNGRVVLIDFWATWCGPCKQELPHMKKLAEQYAGQPFELISVSWDSDEAKWKDFVAANGMTWNQYRDANHSLSNAFGINAIPHYFTIDANGTLAAENLGSGSNIDGRIKKLVQQARESSPTLTAAATTLQ
ncbi:MAG: TlpA family protein disulfide reductase [Janthinobacterium lividum]